MKRRPPFPIPLHVIASATPADQLVWLLRTRNPPILALAEPRGILGLRLHCGPPELQHQIPPDKLHQHIAKLAEMWCAEVDQLPGLPEAWDYTFTETPPVAIPHYFLCDNESSRFTGILCLLPPRHWLIPNDQSTAPRALLPLDGPDPIPPAHAARTWAWYQEFLKQEDTLPPPQRKFLKNPAPPSAPPSK